MVPHSLVVAGQPSFGRVRRPVRSRFRVEPKSRRRRTGGVLAVASTVPMRSRDLAHLSDEALVALVARSDESALAELYDRVGGTAYGLAYRVLRDEALAEDAVQEAFLGLWRSAGSFIPERAKASTWILTLVHRRAVDLVRREQRRRTEPIEGAPEPAVGSAEEAAWLRLDRERVQGALAQLPDQQREAIELAYYGGYTQSELAERLGSAARHDQEPNVLGLDAAARASRRRDREDGHGPTRPDRGLRARRARPGRARPLRGAPRLVRALPRGAAGLLAGRGRARPRGRRPDAARVAPRADPRAGARRAAERRAAAPPHHDARPRFGRGRRGGASRSRSASGRSASPATSTTRTACSRCSSDPNARVHESADGEANLVVTPTGRAALVVRRLAPAPRGQGLRDLGLRGRRAAARPACSSGRASRCSRGGSRPGRRSRSRSSRTAASTRRPATRSSPPSRRSPRDSAAF